MAKKHHMKSVVRPWLANHCSFKEQAVVLSALRGCDGIPKEDISKKFTRKLRSVLFYPAMVNVMSDEVDKYMKTTIEPWDVTRLCKHLDHYPMHWVMHFAHACEIIGYRHPNQEIRQFWHEIYVRMVREGLHLQPESVQDLDARLGDPDEWYPLMEDLKTRDPNRDGYCCLHRSADEPGGEP